MSLTNLLKGKIEAAKVHSDINGELTVIRDLTYGTYIHGGGLPQSGGLAEHVWKSALNKIRNSKHEIQNCLIVGLGGGSIAKLVRKSWPESKITGIDIDPVIVELGKKYMGLDKYDVEIIMGDAYDLFTNHPEKLRHGAGRSQFTDHYDLICFDTYIQQDFPKKFESVSFIKQVKKLLTKNGLAIFNRLYGSEERDRAIAFEKVLLKVFPNVERVYPEANVMFVCSSRPWKACDAN